MAINENMVGTRRRAVVRTANEFALVAACVAMVLAPVGTQSDGSAWGAVARAQGADTLATQRRSERGKNARARTVSMRAYVSPTGQAGERMAGPGNLSTGFEPGQGFAAGFLGGQQGWAVAGSNAEPHVDLVHPASGIQHMRVSNDPAVAPVPDPGNFAYLAFSPDLGPLATGASTTSIDVAISDTAGADYSVIGQSLSEGFITWWVLFRYTGPIWVLDDIGAGFEFVDTGATWTQGSYKKLTVCDDPVAGTTDYFYHGAHIYSQVTHVTGTRVEQLVIGTDNYHVTDDGDFDNVSITSGLSGPCAPSGGFNIDLNPSGRPVPPNTSGGVAGQPGVWNDISFLNLPPNNQLLVDRGGNLTSVGIETDINWQMGALGTQSVTWDPELMNDFGQFNQVQSTITVTDLPSGTYEVYVYSFSAGGPGGDLGITIDGITKTIQGPGFDPGGQVHPQTWEVFTRIVHPGGNLPILLDRATTSVGLVNGLQITTVEEGESQACCFVNPECQSGPPCPFGQPYKLCVDIDPTICPGLGLGSGFPGGPNSWCVPDLYYNMGNQPDGSIPDSCEFLFVDPGSDRFDTPPGGGRFDFCDDPIPAGFFDVGSMPFTDVLVCEGSHDLSTVVSRCTETAFEQFFNPPTMGVAWSYAGDDIVPRIRLVELDLKSVNPITVTMCNGPDQQWDVRATLSSTRPKCTADICASPVGSPPYDCCYDPDDCDGTLRAFRTHENGGDYTAEFKVQPQFIFCRTGGSVDCSMSLQDVLALDCQSNPDCRKFDTGAEGLDPITLKSRGAPFVFVPSVTPGPGQEFATNFAPGVMLEESFQNPTDHENPAGYCCHAVCHEATPGPQGIFPPGHQHCSYPRGICPECLEGACCDDTQPLICDVVRATQCMGPGKHYAGPGTACDDEDGDGIPDWLEGGDCCDPPDGCNTSTSPHLPDTDGDGCDDGDEVYGISGNAATDACDPCDFDPACLSPPAVDCNGNGREDVVDIQTGCSPDLDADWVPDECGCPAGCGSPTTRSFCIVGLSKDLGWSWCVSDGTFNLCDLRTPGVPACETPDVLATRFVDSINDAAASAGCAGVDATLINPPGCFEVNVCNATTFDISVGPYGQEPNCTAVPGTDCEFNPVLIAMAGPPTLDPPVNYSVGDFPLAVAAGDFDADGDQDLAVANSNASSVTIYRNTGNGTYQFAATLNTGQNAVDIIALDLDADGDLDLAVAAGNLVTFRNDGTGTFSAWLTTGVGCCPTSLAFGDFNNDCSPDIAVTNLNPPSNDIAIVLNNGDWTAPTVASFFVGNNPRDVAVGDIEGDGDLDLVVSTGGENVAVMLNDGSGSFPAISSVASGLVGCCLTAIAMGDLNADGLPDVVVTNGNTDSIAVLLNQGSGSFGAPTVYNVGNFPGDVALVDIDGDNDLDLALSNRNQPYQLQIMSNDWNGNFGVPVNFALGGAATGLAVADLNYDGTRDIAVALSGPNEVAVLLNQTFHDCNGDGFDDRSMFTLSPQPRFEILGTSDQVGWPWSISNNSGFSAEVLDESRPCVTFGGGPAAFALAYVQSINDNSCPTIRSRRVPGQPGQFEIMVPGTLPSLGVGPAGVPVGTPAGCFIPPSSICSFNPDLVAVNPTGTPPNPLTKPQNLLHHALKHRYLSVDATTNLPDEVSIKVEIAEMNRCANDLRRSCNTAADCPTVCETDKDIYSCGTGAICNNGAGGNCIASGPCVPHPDVGLSWFVQEPQTRGADCPNGMCDEEDYYARLGPDPWGSDWKDECEDATHLPGWTEGCKTLPIGDCQINPAVVYNVYACDPITGNACSGPLVVETQRKVAGPPHYGDIAGGVTPALMFEPPDGFVSVRDVSAYLLTNQNWGTPNLPQAHPTWIDLHGSGTGIPPQYVLNITDLTLILRAWVDNWPWENPLGGLAPGDCP